MSKWVGDAETNMRALFDQAAKQELAVIFFDEIEALVSRRGKDSAVMDRLIPEFLSLVDGVEGRRGSVLLLGACNRPWDMDEAALRPGRFNELIYVGPPDATARAAILAKELEGVPVAPSLSCSRRRRTCTISRICRRRTSSSRSASTPSRSRTPGRASIPTGCA